MVYRYVFPFSTYDKSYRLEVKFLSCLHSLLHIHLHHNTLHNRLLTDRSSATPWVCYPNITSSYPNSTHPSIVCLRNSASSCIASIGSYSYFCYTFSFSHLHNQELRFHSRFQIVLSETSMKILGAISNSFFGPYRRIRLFKMFLVQLQNGSMEFKVFLSLFWTSFRRLMIDEFEGASKLSVIIKELKMQVPNLVNLLTRRYDVLWFY